jgi:hypothetical protein
MYTIIEDCSPFYIRFTHPGIERVIDFCNQHTPKTSKRFEHCKFSPEVGAELLNLVPVCQQIPLMKQRASLFITAPGTIYRAHKDGPNHRFSINYTTKILDDLCITSWYDDEDLKNYPIDTLGGVSRECDGFDKNNHTPIKTMTAEPNEIILFNTEIFHAWDNSQSPNVRVVLTLRAVDPGNMYFEDARQRLFGSTVRTQH